LTDAVDGSALNEFENSEALPDINETFEVPSVDEEIEESVFAGEIPVNLM
jgi:hypothetical protein